MTISYSQHLTTKYSEQPIAITAEGAKTKEEDKGVTNTTIEYLDCYYYDDD